jgi:hypothetical protein
MITSRRPPYDVITLVIRFQHIPLEVEGDTNIQTTETISKIHGLRYWTAKADCTSKQIFSLKTMEKFVGTMKPERRYGSGHPIAETHGEASHWGW